MRRVILIVLFFAIGYLHSCCKEETEGHKIEVIDFKGNFEGTMTSSSFGNLIGSDTIGLKLSKDSIEIPNLPVRPFIETILGEGEDARTLLEKLGIIFYNIAYTYSKESDDGLVNILLEPKNLIINLELNSETRVIEVNISAIGQGVYHIQSEKIVFSLVANSVKVNGADFAFKPITVQVEAIISRP